MPTGKPAQPWPHDGPHRNHHVIRRGRYRSGNPHYYCHDCGRSFTQSVVIDKRFSKSGPMTSTERGRRHRAKLKQQQESKRMSKNYETELYYWMFTKLSNVKAKIQSGDLRIELLACNWSPAVAFLLPVKDIEGLPLKTISVSSIRNANHENWQFYKEQMLEANLDAVFLTYRSKNAMVLVSARFKDQLPVPLTSGGDDATEEK